MTIAIVLGFAWFLGTGSFAAARRVRKAEIEQSTQPDASIMFLMEEITARGGAVVVADFVRSAA